MKPVIDMELTFLGKYLSNMMLCNTIKNYWGTTTIGGVEVFNHKFRLYPKPNTINYKKIVSLLRLKSKLDSATFKDLEEYYLSLTPNKLTDTEYNNDMLLGKLNSYISTSEYTTVFLSVLDGTDPAKFNSMSKQQLTAYVINNYPSLVDQLVVNAGNNLLENTIGKFVLLDLGQCLDVKFDSINVTSIRHTTTTTVKFREVTTVYYTSAIGLQLSFKRINVITSTSNLFIGIRREESEAVTRALNELANSESNTDLNVIINKPKSGLTNDIWYQGYLRASVVKERTMKRAYVAKLIGEALDTGYTRKKVKKSWWQKALAPVLFIVAVFLAPWTGGSSLAAFAAYWAVVAVAFTVLSFAMAKWGDTVSAEYMGKYAKVSGYISAVSGIASFFQNMMKNIALQGIKSYITSSISNMVQSITNTFTSAQSGSLISEVGSYIMDNFRAVIAKTVTIGNKIASYWMNKRAERQAKLMSVNGAIIDGQLEALSDYADKEYNIAVEDIKLYTKPLTVDNMQFETDYLYEPSKYNICRPSFIVPGLNIRSTKVGK